MLTRISAILTPVLLILPLSGCGDDGGERAERPDISATQVSVSKILPEEEGGPTSVLGQYDIEDGSPETLQLPDALTEISGLATTSDGRLFGHNDETGVVRQISIGSGDASKWFNVGSITLSEDLEGIAVVEETFYLVNSKGDIFEFKEGVQGGSVDFVHHKTDLSGKFDVEGLCYDPGTNALLLACKEFPGDGLDEKELTRKLEELRKPPGFTGRAPGGPSRWATERSGEWEPLDPVLVVEVAYDHFTGGRFRHGTKFIRWRPDKAPRQCTMDQIDQSGGRALRLLREAA